MPIVFCKNCKKEIEISAKDNERSSIFCHDCLFPTNTLEKTSFKTSPDNNNSNKQIQQNFNTKR